jgi:hypothetical protein
MITQAMMTEIIKYTGGAVLALIGLVTWFFKSGTWKEIKLRKRSLDFVKGMESLQRIYLVMSRVQQDFASRVIIFSGHDAGGLPRVGSGFWVSALHWVEHPRNEITNFGDYANISVDLQYINMLLESQKEGTVFIKVAEMPASLLKSYYSAEGVSESLIVFLGIREKSMFYMSIARYTDDQPFSTMDLARIKLACQPILNEFQAYSLT